MGIPKIPESEYRFCLILWEQEPVTATEMVKLCQEQLGWKRTTTYTVIKRLSERGILKMENGIVSSATMSTIEPGATADASLASSEALPRVRRVSLMVPSAPLE